MVATDHVGRHLRNPARQGLWRLGLVSHTFPGLRCCQPLLLNIAHLLFGYGGLSPEASQGEVVTRLWRRRGEVRSSGFGVV